MHRRLALAAALGVAAVLAAPSAAPGTVTAGGNPLNDAMELFPKQLAERSKGRIKLDVHIANALAKGEAAT